LSRRRPPAIHRLRSGGKFTRCLRLSIGRWAGRSRPSFRRRCHARRLRRSQLPRPRARSSRLISRSW
jgi:hypothetical protein